MTIRTTGAGGTDWDDEQLTDTDLNETVNTAFDEIFAAAAFGLPQDLGVEPIDTSGGAITLTGGKTYRCSSLNVVTNNLTLGASADYPTIIIVDGDAVVSATITGDGKGGSAGAAGSDSNGTAGTAHTATNGPGAGGGGAGIKAGSAGAAGVMVGYTNTPSNMQTVFNVLPGPGGGGGGDTTTGEAGAGGAGGAALVIICKGDFDGSGGTITLDGANGVAGTLESGSGGGGAGGMLVIAYGGSYDAPTITITGGTGGVGTGGSVAGSGGGGDSIGGVATAGDAGGGDGDGGNGSAGASYAFAITADRS